MRRKLDTPHQIFIVQCLAQFMTPTETADAVKEDFGFDVSRQLVAAYHPDRNPELAENWKTLFTTTRVEFLSSVSKIGIAHQAYRLAQLHDMATRAKRMKNYALAAQLLEQAAKERGGQFTNKQRIEVTEIGDKKKKLAELLQIEPEQLPEKKPAIH